MYYDGTVEFMGQQNMAYFIIAIIILVISNVFILTHPNEVVPSLPQQVSHEQPRFENVHGVFPRILS